MTTPLEVLTQARTLVAAHTPLALQPDALQRLDAQWTTMPAAPAPDRQGAWTEANAQAVLAAAQALDFCSADAHCIARAWQCQTQRSGRFDPLSWPTEPQDFGLPDRPVVAAQAAPSITTNTIDRAISVPAFAPCPKQLGLYAVLPDAAWVARMARAGVPTLQLRFKSDDPQAIAHEVRAAVQAVQGTPARLFINDHWQAAIQAGAYGVHLGQEDLDCADLHAIRAAGLRLGLSSHGYAELLRAAAVRPSYIALGAVYATTLKRMATPPQGPHRLQRYVQLLRHFPTVAIGGIDATHLPEVLASGVGSVAVVRALVAAEQPEMAVTALQHCLATTLNHLSQP